MCALFATGVTRCNQRAATQEYLKEARQGFTTQLIQKVNIGEPASQPATGDLELVKYHSAIGELRAYVSHRPLDKGKHPAIIWIGGGFSNSISEIAWMPGKPNNDQSASVFRKAGILMDVITSPTFVFEGVNSPSIASMKFSHNPHIIRRSNFMKFQRQHTSVEFALYRN